MLLPLSSYPPPSSTFLNRKARFCASFYHLRKSFRLSTLGQFLCSHSRGWDLGNKTNLCPWYFFPMLPIYKSSLLIFIYLVVYLTFWFPVITCVQMLNTKQSFVSPFCQVSFQLSLIQVSIRGVLRLQAVSHRNLLWRLCI